MTSFTPLSAAFGGVLMGLSASMLILLNGRIAGVGSILGGLLVVRRGDIAWRLTFILGLIAAPAIYMVLGGQLPSIAVTSSAPLLVVGGLIVGFGARLGSGCTSGHGICGIARLSLRSIVATAVFMATGTLTVLVTRHILGV